MTWGSREIVEQFSENYFPVKLPLGKVGLTLLLSTVDTKNKYRVNVNQTKKICLFDQNKEQHEKLSAQASRAWRDVNEKNPLNHHSLHFTLLTNIEAIFSLSVQNDDNGSIKIRIRIAKFLHNNRFECLRRWSWNGSWSGHFVFLVEEILDSRLDAGVSCDWSILNFSAELAHLSLRFLKVNWIDLLLNAVTWRFDSPQCCRRRMFSWVQIELSPETIPLLSQWRWSAQLRHA